MSRIPPLDPTAATGKAKDLLAAVAAAFGATPNLLKTAAQAPAALEGLLGLSGALANGALPPKARESLAVAVAELNGCDYCLSAHAQIGRSLGLSEHDIAIARTARADDAHTQAILGFARAVVTRRGKVSDADLEAARAAGLDDNALLEVVAGVALNIFTNYLHGVSQAEIDFPRLHAGVAQAA